jgi:hypothetical protein
MLPDFSPTKVSDNPKADLGLHLLTAEIETEDGRTTTSSGKALDFLGVPDGI